MIEYSNDFNNTLGLHPRGTLVKGKCLEGYKTQGKLRKRCKKDGNWMGHDITCTLITCPMLTSLEQGKDLEIVEALNKLLR